MVTAREFNRSVFESMRTGEIDGIVIVDVYEAERHPWFLDLTRRTLSLMAEIDPRRHRRVCRQIKYIVNTKLLSAAQFERRLNACPVDAVKMFKQSAEDNARLFGAILVHEATHGVLEEKLILYVKEKRERIEALCHEEEYRFALHFGKAWADLYIGPFRPELWKLSWDGTFFERLSAYVKRLSKD